MTVIGGKAYTAKMLKEYLRGVKNCFWDKNNIRETGRKN